MEKINYQRDASFIRHFVSALRQDHPKITDEKIFSVAEKWAFGDIPDIDGEDICATIGRMAYEISNKLKESD